MGQDVMDDGLDSKSRKRLEKLQEAWERPGEWSSPDITVKDLRLLLEYFSPLHDLIRAIATATPSEEAGEYAEHNDALIEQRDKAEAELAQATQQLQGLEHDLKQCNAAAEALLSDKKALERGRKQLEKQLEQVQQELNTCQAELRRSGQAPAELALLRQEAELAQQLGLPDLPADETGALIQMVAVLAQRDSLERLWHALKERCEVQNREATAGENSLLQSAVSWYNYNWRSRPYQLITPAAGSAYDFERQQRSGHTHHGERISALRLPGIADGSDKPVCKALVTTQ